MSVASAFDPLRAARDGPWPDADRRETVTRGCGRAVCVDARGGSLDREAIDSAVVGRSGDATAPQCVQKDFESDERRPQFWHSMAES
jgi:hypothetical protein